MFGSSDNARLGVAMKVQKATAEEIRSFLKQLESKHPTPKPAIPPEKLRIASQGFQTITYHSLTSINSLFTLENTGK